MPNTHSVARLPPLFVGTGADGTGGWALGGRFGGGTSVEASGGNTGDRSDALLGAGAPVGIWTSGGFSGASIKL